MKNVYATAIHIIPRSVSLNTEKYFTDNSVGILLASR